MSINLPSPDAGILQADLPRLAKLAQFSVCRRRVSTNSPTLPDSGDACMLRVVRSISKGLLGLQLHNVGLHHEAAPAASPK